MGRPKTDTPAATTIGVRLTDQEITQLDAARPKDVTRAAWCREAVVRRLNPPAVQSPSQATTQHTQHDQPLALGYRRKPSTACIGYVGLGRSCNRCGHTRQEHDGA